MPLTTTLKFSTRAANWNPLVIAWAVSIVLIVVTVAAMNPHPVNRMANLTICLRVSAIIIGIGAAFALIDVMEPTFAAAPRPRRRRRWIRTGVAFVIGGTAWLVILAGAWAAFPATMTFPGPGFLAEGGMCVLTALAATAVPLRRRSDWTAGVMGCALTLTLCVATLFLTGPAWPWPWAGDPVWDTVHARWLGVLPIPIAVLLHANRDVVLT
ncbi:hypothetical protein ACFWYW_22930 [Nonomuraea sp. NPDC059023]|uniref:hypothetical protein n=1 Tax=unclassified Nonomuraea TaxID=2593643 RepID=UPI00368FEAE5